MKLRRTLVTVAATAVIAPAALLSATAAFADTTVPGTDTSASASASPSDSASPSASASTSATPAASASTTASTKATTSAPATATTSAKPTVPTTPGKCVDTSDPESADQPAMDKTFTVTLSGLPSKIVAGSGWHGLTIDVANNSAKNYKRVDFGAFAAAASAKDMSDTSRHLKLQFKNPGSGVWQNVSLNESNPDFGGLGWTDVRAHEKFKLSLRIQADASTPAGFGFVIAIGAYADGKGDCVFSSGENSYEFDILKARTNPGHVPDSKPQTGGTKPLPAVKPANTTQVTPEGRLAETGSSSVMPQLALAGGAAVAVGVGAMFIVRRRKAGSAV